MKRTHYILPFLLMLTFSACASTGGSRSSDKDMNVITSERIQETSYTDAYALVRALRPMWLRKGGQMSISSSSYVKVYRDGTLLGGVGTLGRIHTNNIAEVRYLRPTQASSRFGMNNLKGAIVVTTR